MRWTSPTPLAVTEGWPMAFRGRSAWLQGPYLPRSALSIPSYSDSLAGALAHSVEDKDSHIYVLPFG